MKTKNVLSTKRISEVPFKSELYGKDVSFDLIRAAGNKKTYPEFVKSCKNPKLLFEILLLKHSDSHFPSLKKVGRIFKYATTAATITAFFRGKQAAQKIECTIYKTYLPKKQYADEI